MKKIYVVTSGEYSDYHIEGIFDSNELAESFMEAFAPDKYNEPMCVNEWDLNSCGFKKGLKAYRVELKPTTGDVVEIRQERSCFIFNYYENGVTETMDKTLNIGVFAKDEKHAIKIANEKRAMYLANH